MNRKVGPQVICRAVPLSSYSHAPRRRRSELLLEKCLFTPETAYHALGHQRYGATAYGSYPQDQVNWHL